MGRDLIYLKSEDHYIDAFTVVGSSLIKMRFADAVAELGNELGTQVHRCYWVTYRHMKELVKRDRKFVLLLTGDYEVPVSSTYRASVRMAMKQQGDPVQLTRHLNHSWSSDWRCAFSRTSRKKEPISRICCC